MAQVDGDARLQLDAIGIRGLGLVLVQRIYHRLPSQSNDLRGRDRCLRGQRGVRRRRSYRAREVSNCVGEGGPGDAILPVGSCHSLAAGRWPSWATKSIAVSSECADTASAVVNSSKVV